MLQLAVQKSLPREMEETSMHSSARAEMARCQPSKRVQDLHGGLVGASGAMTINSSLSLSPLVDATAAVWLVGPACASFALAMIRGLQNPFRLLNSPFLSSIPTAAAVAGMCA